MTCFHLIFFYQSLLNAYIILWCSRDSVAEKAIVRHTTTNNFLIANLVRVLVVWMFIAPQAWARCACLETVTDREREVWSTEAIVRKFTLNRTRRGQMSGTQIFFRDWFRMHSSQCLL